MMRAGFFLVGIFAAAGCRPPRGLQSGSGESNLWALSGSSQGRYLSGQIVYPLGKPADHCYEAGGGVGAFGASRDRGTRRHAGCDLYGSVGEAIYAIEDGEVIQPAYDFYCGTDALEVRHADGVVIRYGEIRKNSSVTGSVKKGQQIALMGQLNCYFQPMLHFEMYSGAASGSLSGVSEYRRRWDLTDPTQYLFAWRSGSGGAKARCDWTQVQKCLRYSGGNACYAKWGCVDKAPGDAKVEEFGGVLPAGSSTPTAKPTTPRSPENPTGGTDDTPPETGGQWSGSTGSQCAGKAFGACFSAFPSCEWKNETCVSNQ